jgi:hypothetical protein
MASIKIGNLGSAGSDMFKDSETFLNELSADRLELTEVVGATYTSFITYPTFYRTRSFSFTRWTYSYGRR